MNIKLTLAAKLSPTYCGEGGVGFFVIPLSPLLFGKVGH